MYKKTKTLILLAASALASAATAQDDVGSVHQYRSYWAGHLETLSINSDVAQSNGIGDSGFGLGASYHGERGLLNFNVGATFFLVDDEAKFRQRVENTVSGDESTESSSVDAGSIFVDAGVQYPVSERVVMGLNAGYRYMDFERGINSCVDCYSEGISVESDTYLKPFARFVLNHAYSADVAYFAYQGDKGAENSLQFSFNFGF